MSGTRKTPVVARELDIGYHRLNYLIRSGKIKPPEKDSSGDYAWTDEDVKRVRVALKDK